MRRIDQATWPRRKHFQVFHSFDHPHFNMCANVDLTIFNSILKERSVSFTVAFVYVLARVANEIPEFRHRIRSVEVIEHEIVHPSITVLKNDELFIYCDIEFSEDFPSFAVAAARKIAFVKENPTLEDELGQDNLLYMTAIPWVSFTSFMHPALHDSNDSVPRIAWGKFFREGDALKVPLSVQGHHALMDGIHMGRYYSKVQGYLNQPKALFGEG